MDPRQLIKPLLLAAGLGIVMLALGVPSYYLVLLLLVVGCPLMMFFMMRGMDHGGATHRDRKDHPSPAIGDKTETPRTTFSLRPVDDDGEFTRTGMWLMAGGCCLSLPLALLILALTGSTLVESRPIFIAIFARAGGTSRGTPTMLMLQPVPKSTSNQSISMVMSSRS